MKIYARNDYVICKPYKSEEKSGLIIANRNCDNIAVVVATNAMTINVNDILIYNKEKAMELNIDGVTYIAFRWEDVIAHIEEEK